MNVEPKQKKKGGNQDQLWLQKRLGVEPSEGAPAMLAPAI